MESELKSFGILVTIPDLKLYYRGIVIIIDDLSLNSGKLTGWYLAPVSKLPPNKTQA